MLLSLVSADEKGSDFLVIDVNGKLLNVEEVEEQEKMEVDVMEEEVAQNEAVEEKVTANGPIDAIVDSSAENNNTQEDIEEHVDSRAEKTIILETSMNSVTETDSKNVSVKGSEGTKSLFVESGKNMAESKNGHVELIDSKAENKCVPMVSVEEEDNSVIFKSLEITGEKKIYWSNSAYCYVIDNITNEETVNFLSENEQIESRDSKAENKIIHAQYEDNLVKNSSILEEDLEKTARKKGKPIEHAASTSDIKSIPGEHADGTAETKITCTLLEHAETIEDFINIQVEHADTLGYINKIPAERADDTAGNLNSEREDLHSTRETKISPGKYGQHQQKVKKINITTKVTKNIPLQRLDS